MKSRMKVKSLLVCLAISSFTPLLAIGHEILLSDMNQQQKDAAKQFFNMLLSRNALYSPLSAEDAIIHTYKMCKKDLVLPCTTGVCTYTKEEVIGAVKDNFELAIKDLYDYNVEQSYTENDFIAWKRTSFIGDMEEEFKNAIIKTVSRNTSTITVENKDLMRVLYMHHSDYNSKLAINLNSTGEKVIGIISDDNFSRHQLQVTYEFVDDTITIIATYKTCLSDTGYDRSRCVKPRLPA